MTILDLRKQTTQSTQSRLLSAPVGFIPAQRADVVDASDRGARTPNFDIPVPLWAVLSATALLSVLSTLALFIYGQGSLGI
jgi:hypothetical protein